MNLRTQYPYWLLRDGIIRSYPSLDRNISADVAVIGAGISGVLAAWHLTSAGFHVVIADRRQAGMGSTAANTSLLQYEIDIPLSMLIKKIGGRKAIRSYELCRDSIDDLESICRHPELAGLFRRRPSLQFASYKNDVDALKIEYDIRKKAGFKLNWLDENSLNQKFHLRKPAGIISAGAAETDAYKLTHGLLRRAISHGAQLFDHTDIKAIRYHGKKIELITAGNNRIRAKYLVIAAGYESQRYLNKKVEEFHSTYAIISEPLFQKEYWYKNALIWETSLPYLYLRTTDDKRIIIGGKDIPYYDPIKRDRLLSTKTHALENAFSKLFPHIPFKTDFNWAGTFGSTKDGLPFIGSISGKPNTFFSLGFGGNGIIFSVLAARLISETIQGKKNPDLGIFSFNR